MSALHAPTPKTVFRPRRQASQQRLNTTDKAATIGGGGYDDSVPRVVTKTAPSADRLHDYLHGRQACPAFNSFHLGVGQICPRDGLFSCRPLQKRGQICDIPSPPLPPPPPLRSLNDFNAAAVIAPVRRSFAIGVCMEQLCHTGSCTNSLRTSWEQQNPTKHFQQGRSRMESRIQNVRSDFYGQKPSDSVPTRKYSR